MTNEELDSLWLWLKVTYPKRYKSLSDMEAIIAKDNLAFIFEKYGLDEVMVAYRYFHEKLPYEPTASEIKTYIAERATKPETKQEFSEEHHYTKGRYVHEEAEAAWRRDQQNGTRNGRTFADYVKEYPKYVWRPWVLGCPDYWLGTKYEGWERTEDGLIKPKGAPSRRNAELMRP